mgnify:CR=1 FL=1
MAMDETDRALLKGMLGFGVLAGVLYFYPFDWPMTGFRTQVQKVEDARSRSLKPKYDEYKKYYEVQTKAVIGEADVQGEDAVRPIGAAQMADRLREYQRKSEELRGLIVEKEKASRMDFAFWTEVPAEEREPGFYFQRKWDQIRYRLENEARQKNVTIVDRDIGFGKQSGDLRMTRERATEFLRQLFIAEKVITLCILAKQEQEDLERKNGLKPEAFVKIISVMPEDPVRIGPYSRTPNPKYDKDERNPKSERYQKYLTREWDKFILMYPVEIRLQCDVNSFRNFLNSVRSQKGQFLVIRNLEMVSWFMKESRVDDSAWSRLAPSGESNDFKQEHILVKLSAAGMDFFEPEKKIQKPVPVVEQTPSAVRMPMGH